MGNYCTRRSQKVGTTTSHKCMSLDAGPPWTTLLEGHSGVDLRDFPVASTL